MVYNKLTLAIIWLGMVLDEMVDYYDHLYDSWSLKAPPITPDE